MKGVPILPPDFGEHVGYVGAFTRFQMPGAIRNGSTVRKVQEDEGDATPLGTLGIVLGSIGTGKLERPPGSTRPILFGYFVEWADRPRHAIFTVDWKIALDG